ncbi:malto-oligosyltrehalose trehalohydrolase [Desulfocastanea catecholica]
MQNTIDFTMDFGTCLDPAGGVLFRLWAPQARQVDLCLTVGAAEKRVLPMTARQDGWFVLHHQAAGPGDWYQFIIDNDLLVPDPVSRCQAGDIHGPSVICNPDGYSWHDGQWQGRPWEEAVLYELHVGTFSPEGTFHGVTKRLDYLVQLGITAIELMPVAQFPGDCNWGYDGALLFAPCNRYGGPDELKELVDAAHQRGLMVFLDVVYNHFGPEGNYLYVYARDAFFTEQFHTPWGAAINFSGPDSRIVRDFYIANALYWLEEFHIDGLRFDAVHSIFDQSRPDILEEIAKRVRGVREGPGRRRHIHLILENDHNCARYLTRKANGQPQFFTAQWNDDFHHACHILLTGETEGYYQDYSDRPIHHLGRCLTEGFAYQGEQSPYRQGEKRGEPSAHLPPSAFVSFLQNHDQIGNRALGERLPALADQQDLEIFIALFLLAPSPPLLFMGEEFGAQTPFYYFCDFSDELAASVTAGRRKEFARFAQFSSPESRARIPDPNSIETFLLSRLNWQAVEQNPDNSCLLLYRNLLLLRQQIIVPRVKDMRKNRAGFQVLAEKALKAWWQSPNDELLTVVFNLHDQAITVDSRPMDTSSAEKVESMAGERAKLIYQYSAEGGQAWSPDVIAPKSIVWMLETTGDLHD